MLLVPGFTLRVLAYFTQEIEEKWFDKLHSFVAIVVLCIKVLY